MTIKFSDIFFIFSVAKHDFFIETTDLDEIVDFSDDILNFLMKLYFLYNFRFF